MKSNASKKITPKGNLAKSKSGYLFNPKDEYWVLDKNTKICVGSVHCLLESQIAIGYIKTLIYFATNLSASHTKNINERFLHFIRTTKASSITDSVLINYRATLSRNTEWYLGTIRGFLRKWYDLCYEGVSDDVIELLDN